MIGHRLHPFDGVLVAAVLLLSGACAAKPEVQVSPVTRDAWAGHPYFENVKKNVAARLKYPCIANARTGVCEPLTADVGVDFGILRDGTLRYVEIARPSGYRVYDDEAVRAVRSAAPFPPVPDDVMAALPVQSTGVPIRANFRFNVQYAR